VNTGPDSGAPDTLVLLTDAYPFGRVAETFLDAELPVLARRFARIVVLPSRREEDVRPLPPGVRCDELLVGLTRDDIIRELLRHPLWLGRQYGRALREESSRAPYFRRPAPYVATVGANMVKYRLLRSFVRSERLQDAVFYDYWLGNSTLALSWLRRERILRRAVARAHLVDLYDEASEAGAVPFRAFNVTSLDRVFAISEHGLSYLAARHPAARGKLVLSRLGAEARRAARPAADQSTPLVVSCAGLRPVKRVERIPAILARVGRPLRWIHFGDGPCRAAVERAASALPPEVEWTLAGHVDHAALLDFYASNRVDLLVSVSASEGLPVSMMEAIGFGIPILAADAGAVHEIVTSSTGCLVGVEAPDDSIASAARDLLDGKRPPPEEIIEFFRAHFDAKANFGEFADQLLSL
jgi:glycosyltransferase involved in cell wall biosynthesis